MGVAAAELLLMGVEGDDGAYHCCHCCLMADQGKRWWW
jgi:hypothetical protein